jgi:signal transduction histidine kinase
MHEVAHHSHRDGSPYPVEECRIDEAFRTGHEAHVEGEVFWRRDGSSFPVEYWTRPVMMKGGRFVGAVVTFTDVTERRRLEEQFRQAQKMDAIGRLAGGVAHDFNNLLSVIGGFGSLLQQALPPDALGRPFLDEILAAGECAATPTQQLLVFSRKQVLKTEVVELNAIVASMERMLSRLIGEDVDLVTIPAAHLGAVRADRGQIEQVIMNLAVNARDARRDAAGREIDDRDGKRRPRRGVRS